MNKREDCNHPELIFSFGDLYIFCTFCGAKWGTLDQDDQRNPSVSNQGIGQMLSGAKRVVK